MDKSLRFDPDWTSPPGDTIMDILDSKGMSIEDLAELTDSTPDAIQTIVQGRVAITIAIARDLERALGSSREFWISRDFQFRQQVAKLRGDSEAWIRTIPVSDMISFGWLRPAPKPVDEVATCLRFFGVPTVQAWHEKYDKILEVVNFRTSTAFESWPASTAAWLRQGEIEAARIDCARWDPDGFFRSLEKLRNLTRIKDPQRFLPRLQALSAAHGVAVNVVRAPAGCRASGATRFLSSDKALLLLSFRYLSDDQFWFSFFHEAGHLLLHGGSKWVLEGLGEAIDCREREANSFAETLLVPPDLREEFSTLRLDRRQVMRFARRAGISPGIVVGQMQHHGLLTYSQLNSLKRRYTWVGATRETL